MKFRPCIDIHNGKVKQVVGGSLRDEEDEAVENFVSNRDAKYFAERYKKDNLSGGHVIVLNARDSKYFSDSKKQAMEALLAYPGGMQYGGGVNDKNAREYINAGASHVIVTSFVFSDGNLKYDNLKSLVKSVGKERIVLDLSCRKREGKYYVVTDRWQKFTNVEISGQVLDKLLDYCDEFLVHGVDVEGRYSGIDEELVGLLSEYEKMPITYAGGISTIEQLEKFIKISKGKLDYTIGSALDIFGGDLSYEDLKRI